MGGILPTKPTQKIPEEMVGIYFEDHLEVGSLVYFVELEWNKTLQYGGMSTGSGRVSTLLWDADCHRLSHIIARSAYGVGPDIPSMFRCQWMLSGDPDNPSSTVNCDGWGDLIVAY